MAMALMLALLLGAVSALAETRSVSLPYQEVTMSARSSTLIVQKERGDKYILMDADLHELTVYPYTDMSYNGMSDAGILVNVEAASADGLHRKGMIDTTGRELIPPVYAAIDVLSDRWQVGIKLTPSNADDNDYTVTNYSDNSKSFYRIAATARRWGPYPVPIITARRPSAPGYAYKTVSASAIFMTASWS